MNPESPQPLLPGPLGALGLTLGAWTVTLISAIALAPAGGGIGMAVGLVLGFGGIATMAARGVPAPADVRLGLRRFDARILGWLALLLPLPLLLSELDNWVGVLLPVERDFPSGDEVGLLGIAESLLFLALLRPVVEEFFFRGVVQHGLVSHRGARAGVLLTAALYSLAHLGFYASDERAAASAALQGVVEGIVLGTLRIASGSILPGILLRTATSALGLFAVVGADALPIPGFNTGDPHTPALWLIPAAVSVALALRLIARAAAAAPNDPPIPEEEPD